MRQYFGDEDYFDSYEKIDWINRASKLKKRIFIVFLLVSLMMIREFYLNTQITCTRMMRLKKSLH